MSQASGDHLPALDSVPADVLYDVIAHVEQGFRATQAELRERVLEAQSVDGLVRLDINGEGLCLRASIAPTLIERGGEAVELGVMQAINDAALLIQEHTTAAFQLAATQYLGFPSSLEPPAQSDA
jgi:DNA-binding protein YbaB